MHRSQSVPNRFIELNTGVLFFCFILRYTHTEYYVQTFSHYYFFSFSKSSLYIFYRFVCSLAKHRERLGTSLISVNYLSGSPPFRADVCRSITTIDVFRASEYISFFLTRNSITPVASHTNKDRFIRI